MLDIDSKYAQSQSLDLYKNRLRLQIEFDLLATDEATRLTMKARHNVYEFGDKASSLLALQARQAAAAHSITKIKSYTGEILTDHDNINKAFFNPITLYLRMQNDLPCNFFENLIIPSVSEDQNTKLCADILVSEIITVVKSMENNKCSALMGSHANQRGTLPRYSSHDTETGLNLIIGEERQRSTLSYFISPISLLNVDFKILSKVLAKRLGSVIPDIISPDQTGFIRGRRSYSNLRKLFNVVYSGQVNMP